MKSFKKYLFLLLLLGMCSANSFAQILAAEYYIDTDPGAGSATALSASDGSFNDALESAIANAVSVAPAGMHTINIRVKDKNGNWGPTFTRAISVENPLSTRATNIALAEFYWDTDPGAGSGTSLVAFDGNFNDALETALKQNISAPALGVHKLCIRVKDAAGTWGPAFTTVVSVENLASLRSTNIALAELYWDTDPGQGSGTPMIAFDGNFNDALETALKSGLAAPAVGTHKLCVRVKDPAGSWGPVFTTVVSVENSLAIRSVKITAAELYFDTDPGQGSGTPMLALDGNFDNALESVLNSSVTAPALGTHKLCVRVKDAAGTWGPVFTTVLSVENVFVPRNVQVALAEYYWDTDPGQGSGTAMVAFDGNFNNALETALSANASLPAAGTHKLCIRVKDAASNWGPVFTKVVSVENQFVPRDVKISAAELFIDADPGQGSGTAMLAFDGNFSDALETATHNVNTMFIAPGMHTINARTIDVAGNWGPVFTVAIYVDTCMTTPSPTVTVVGSSTICPGDSVQLTANGGYGSYTWVTGLTPIGTGSSIYIKNPGVYKVTVTDGNNCPGTSASVTVSVFTATVTTTGTAQFCQGDSLTLTAGTAVSYTWSTGANTQSIVVHSGGTYSVNETSGNGCVASSVLTVTMNPLPSVPTITQSGPDLVSSASSGNQWYVNGVLIPGATSSIYTPAQSGNYSVVVTNSFNCPASSAPYPFTYIGIATINSMQSMIVAPNPFDEFTTLSYELQSESRVEIGLYNALGMIVQKVSEPQQQSAGTHTLQVGNIDLPQGVYILKLKINDTLKIVRLVKEK